MSQSYPAWPGSPRETLRAATIHEPRDDPSSRSLRCRARCRARHVTLKTFNGRTRRGARRLRLNQHEIERHVAMTSRVEGQRLQLTTDQRILDEMLGQPRESEPGLHRRERRLHAAHGAAALGTQPAVVAWMP